MRKIDPSKALLEAWQNLPPDQKKLPVYIAVSGGGDSTVLASAAARLRDRLPDMHWLHVNYRLRRPDSDLEEAHLRRWAGQLGIPLHVRKLRPGRKRKNAQAWARGVRFQFFLETIQKQSRGKGMVWLGHHEQDQAETVLLRLLRGSGLSGLAGMEARETILLAGAKKALQLFRPFLKVPKEALRRYLKTQDLVYFEDRSNGTPVYQRNRIRRDILPLCLQENPRTVEALCTFAQRAEAAAETLSGLAAQELNKWFKKNRKIKELPIKIFNSNPPGLWPYLFKEYFHRLGWEEESFSRQIPALERALRKAGEASVFWFQGGKRLAAGDRGLKVLPPSKRKSF